MPLTTIFNGFKKGTKSTKDNDEETEMDTTVEQEEEQQQSDVEEEEEQQQESEQQPEQEEEEGEQQAAESDKEEEEEQDKENNAEEQEEEQQQQPEDKDAEVQSDNEEESSAEVEQPKETKPVAPKKAQKQTKPTAAPKQPKGVKSSSAAPKQKKSIPLKGQTTTKAKRHRMHAKLDLSEYEMLNQNIPPRTMNAWLGKASAFGATTSYRTAVRALLAAVTYAMIPAAQIIASGAGRTTIGDKDVQYVESRLLDRISYA